MARADLDVSPPSRLHAHRPPSTRLQPGLPDDLGRPGGAFAGVLAYDIIRNNRWLGSLMKLVWALTILYSGPVGLAIYSCSGRMQIRRDSLWRKG